MFHVSCLATPWRLFLATHPFEVRHVRCWDRGSYEGYVVYLRRLRTFLVVFHKYLQWNNKNTKLICLLSSINFLKTRFKPTQNLIMNTNFHSNSSAATVLLLDISIWLHMFESVLGNPLINTQTQQKMQFSEVRAQKQTSSNSYLLKIFF